MNQSIISLLQIFRNAFMKYIIKPINKIFRKINVFFHIKKAEISSYVFHTHCHSLNDVINID